MPVTVLKRMPERRCSLHSLPRAKPMTSCSKELFSVTRVRPVLCVSLS
jgi:hypothetical protein